MKKVLTYSIFFLLSACVTSNTVVVRPEALVSSSAERISFPIVDATSVATIENWINGDKPSEAELSCDNGNYACRDVRSILARSGVDFSENHSMSTDSISLIYNRIVARECSNDTLGCATALNSVRMVTDRSQFINPSNTGMQDAERAVTAVGGVLK